jgi:hypothetical protein
VAGGLVVVPAVMAMSARSPIRSLWPSSLLNTVGGGRVSA